MNGQRGQDRRHADAECRAEYVAQQREQHANGNQRTGVARGQDGCRRHAADVRERRDPAQVQVELEQFRSADQVMAPPTNHDSQPNASMEVTRTAEPASRRASICGVCVARLSMK